MDLFAGVVIGLVFGVGISCFVVWTGRQWPAKESNGPFYLTQQKPGDGEEVLTYPGWSKGVRGNENGWALDTWCANYNNFLMCIEDGHQITQWARFPKPRKSPKIKSIQMMDGRTVHLR